MMPLSMACSTIWKTEYFRIVEAAMAPAPELIISAIKESAPNDEVTPSAIL